MPVVGNLDAIDRLPLLTFDDCASTVDRAGYWVANAGDGNAANGEMACSDIGDRATVGCGIAQADDVRHARSLAEVVRNHIQPTSTRLLPGI